MPNLPPSTPAPPRIKGTLVRRANQEIATRGTSDDPQQHLVATAGATSADGLLGMPAIQRPPSSSRLNPTNHPPVLLSSTTTVVYSPAMGRTGAPPQDPGSPTRQRIFNLPSASIASFSEPVQPHTARLDPIHKSGRTSGNRFWAPSQFPVPPTPTIKAMPFPKASGVRPTPLPQQMENVPTVHSDVPHRFAHNEAPQKQAELSAPTRGRQSAHPTVPSNDQRPRPRSGTPNEPQQQNSSLAASISPQDQPKKKAMDSEASRVETFDDLRASSPLYAMGSVKTPIISKAPQNPPVKTGHFVNKLHGKPLVPPLNHATIWKQTIDKVSKDERVYSIEDLDQLRICLDDAVTKMMGIVHAASDTHNELKRTSATTLDERKRKTMLYEQETSRRKHTASSVASTQVRKRAKHH